MRGIRNHSRKKKIPRKQEGAFRGEKGNPRPGSPGESLILFNQICTHLSNARFLVIFSSAGRRKMPSDDIFD
jgi:hypothetical protein